MFYGTLGLFRKRETPYSPELVLTASPSYIENSFLTLGPVTEYLLSNSNNTIALEFTPNTEYLLSNSNNAPPVEFEVNTEFAITQGTTTVPLTISS